MKSTGKESPFGVYEVAEGVYWVGFADWDAGFSNNPYLVVTGDEAVLIDPGSILHYHVVAKKVLSIVQPEQIKAIIVQHQDPDLCASIPKFEALIEKPISVVVPPLASLFMPYYGITSELIKPSEGESMVIAGRRFEFYFTPYVHFAQAMMTYDPSTGALFASDVFAALTKRWQLIADEKYVKETSAFVEPYIGSKRAWLYALKIVRDLAPNVICPQHGSIINSNIEQYLDAVSKFKVARLLPEDWRVED